MRVPALLGSLVSSKMGPGLFNVVKSFVSCGVDVVMDRRQKP